jgi:hypothetical protein
MISASYRNNNSYPNGRNFPIHHRHSRFASQNSSSSSSSNHGLSASNIADFVYKGANKHHWAKLQSKIKQRLMAENISYIDDEEEVIRRSMPPPPAAYLSPPAFIESPQDREERHKRLPQRNGSPLQLPHRVHHHRPRADNSEHHPIHVQYHDTLPRYEGTAPE